MPNNAVTAKARAIHGKFLTKDDYTALVHRTTISQAVAYLRSKPLYSEVFADADEAQIHREQAEELINKNVFDNYIRVCRFAVSKRDGIMSFLVKQLESEQLIKAVIAVSTGAQEGFLASFPDYIAEHLCFDPMKLAKAKKLKDIAEILKGTMYYKPIAKLLTQPEPDTDRIILAINICYIKWAFGHIDEAAKGSTRTTLKDFFLRKIDADNLLMCLRLKSTFGLENARIKELLIPYHRRLRPAVIDAALKANDPDAVLREMLVTERIATAIVSDIPEINVETTDMRYFRKILSTSCNEIISLYSLMMLFRIESTNLCRIIESIRYGLAPEETEKYLII